MSYATAGALQAALFQTLRADSALQAIVGDAIYDAMPAGAVPALYVSLGDEDVRDRSDKDAGGSLHDVAISVITDAPGYAAAKAAAVAISDALSDADLTLSRGRLVGLWFLKARARRIGGGAQRRIDLRFRAQTQDT